jgi:hypothetical protein
MQSFKFIPCYESDLISKYFLEIFEETIQHLVISEVSHIDLLKAFSKNLIKYLRIALKLQPHDHSYELLKKRLCDQYSLIISLEPVIDTDIAVLCVEEIRNNCLHLLTELSKKSDRIDFINQIENIYRRNVDELSILSFLNTLLVPQDNIPTQVESASSTILLSSDSNPVIADLENQYLLLSSKANFFVNLGDRQSLLKAIAIYSGVIPHIEGLRTISVNYAVIISGFRFNLLTALYNYTKLVVNENIEESLIYSRKLLQQFFLLENYPPEFTLPVTIQIDAAKRILAMTLIQYAFTRQLTHRKLLR